MLAKCFPKKSQTKSRSKLVVTA